ncbi:MAG: agmatine deiminase family protein [Kofleriaceae bacterium]|nr:agmatine deiminase family protein [Kofleriaceae bacterium]
MQVRRYPAEWEHHDSLWLARPHDKSEWGDYFDGACQAIDCLIAELTSDTNAEPIDLLVPELETHGLGLQCRQWQCNYGDVWLRDTAPVFVQVGDSMRAQSFDFNGWGGKFLFDGDPELAALVATFAGLERDHHQLVLEGGAIDGNGADTILTTRECLLNKNRNPSLGESDIETLLASALGTKKTIWLDRGLIGDHTDGHVDNVARFTSAERVVCTKASARGEVNEAIYREVHNTLRNARTANGEPLEIVELPSPGEVKGPEGIMAASYCNFLLTNCCVVVPVFDCLSDIEALSILSSLFPERRTVAIPSFALLTGGGTIHCISKEQASPSPPRTV